MGFFHDDDDKNKEFGTVFGPDGIITGSGGTLFGPGNTYQTEVGNAFFGSGGRASFDNGLGMGMMLGGRSGGMVTEIGGMFWAPGGRSYQLVGNVLHCSDGRTWVGVNGPHAAKRIIAMDN